VSATLPVTVVVPTIGRPELLEACLASLAACEPRADEVLVVDQSRGDAVRSVVEPYTSAGVGVLTLDVPNKSLALNLALEQARHDHVLMTDDDCTVAPSWVASAWSQLERDPEAMVTGRVLAAGDERAVPSTIHEETPREYTGDIHYGALYGNNMACRASLVLAEGGYDERLTVAEDNDLCYRWLRSGRRLRYEPELVVWHHAWRSEGELSRLYRRYGQGQGLFYAKHLRAGDLRVVPFLGRDLYRGARGVAARVVRRRTGWPDPRTGLLSGLVAGFIEGWRTFGPQAKRDAGGS
jgi:GT2 family glycosyltransferase